MSFCLFKFFFRCLFRFLKIFFNTCFSVPGRRLDDILQILLNKILLRLQKMKDLYSRERMRAALGFLLIGSSRDFPRAQCTCVHRMHACMYACMRGCIRPYRIDIHEWAAGLQTRCDKENYDTPRGYDAERPRNDVALFITRSISGIGDWKLKCESKWMKLRAGM